MALQLNQTLLLTVTDSTTEQVRNDFRIGIVDQVITQAGNQTFYVATTVVAAAQMDIMPQVTLGAGERLSVYLVASYEAGDNTAAKRLITISVDGNDVDYDLTYGAAVQVTTQLLINRSATAAATATVQMVWHIVPA